MYVTLPESFAGTAIAPGGAVPLKRCLFAAAVTAQNLVMHGGCASGFGDCFLDDTWVLDTNAAGWRELSSQVRPVGRQHQSLVTTPNPDQLILFGGQDAGRQQSAGRGRRPRPERRGR